MKRSFLSLVIVAELDLLVILVLSNCNDQFNQLWYEQLNFGFDRKPKKELNFGF